MFKSLNYSFNKLISIVEVYNAHVHCLLLIVLRDRIGDPIKPPMFGLGFPIRCPTLKCDIGEHFFVCALFMYKSIPPNSSKRTEQYALRSLID